jgi:hypothetical protein
MGLKALAGLCRGPDEDLVHADVVWAGDGEGDDVGDVLGADRDLLVELLAALPGFGVGDVVGEFGCDGAGLDDDDADTGLQFLPYRL